MYAKSPATTHFSRGSFARLETGHRCCGRRPSTLVPRLAVAVFLFRRIRRPWRAADGLPWPGCASMLGPRRLRHTPPISGPTAGQVCTCAGAGVQAASSCLLAAALAGIASAVAWRRGCAWLRRPAAPRRPFRARRVAGPPSEKKGTASAALIAGRLASLHSGSRRTASRARQRSQRLKSRGLAQHAHDGEASEAPGSKPTVTTAQPAELR